MDIYERRERWPVGQINPKTGLSIDFKNVTMGIIELAQSRSKKDEATTQLGQHLSGLLGYRERYEKIYNNIVEVTDQNRNGMARIEEIITELKTIGASSSINKKTVLKLAKEINSIIEGNT